MSAAKGVVWSCTFVYIQHEWNPFIYSSNNMQSKKKNVAVAWDELWSHAPSYAIKKKKQFAMMMM